MCSIVKEGKAVEEKSLKSFWQLIFVTFFGPGYFNHKGKISTKPLDCVIFKLELGSLYTRRII